MFLIVCIEYKLTKIKRPIIILFYVELSNIFNDELQFLSSA